MRSNSRLWMGVLPGFVFLFCISCGSKSHTKLPTGYLDSPPLSQQAVFRGPTTLEGWSLSDDGIDDVAIYIDRQYVASAQIGIPRADVAGAFPNEPHASTSGWRASIDVSNIPPGMHEVVVQATCKNGAKRDIASFRASVMK